MRSVLQEYLLIVVVFPDTVRHLVDGLREFAHFVVGTYRHVNVEFAFREQFRAVFQALYVRSHFIRKNFRQKQREYGSEYYRKQIKPEKVTSDAKVRNRRCKHDIIRTENIVADTDAANKKAYSSFFGKRRRSVAKIILDDGSYEFALRIVKRNKEVRIYAVDVFQIGS